MADELFVLIGDLLAARITRKHGILRMRYEASYQDNHASTPLSVSLPVEVAEHTHQSVWTWLAGLLPDSDAVLERWARAFHASAGSPFSLLSTPVGEDCAGAVRFVTSERLEDALNRVGDVEWLTDAAVAERLRDLRRDSTAWLGTDFTGRFSLAGAQAKTALLYQDGVCGVPSGAAATSHIFKPAIAGFDEHDLNEHLCLHAARQVGLSTAKTKILRFETESAVVAERYDRRAKQSGWLQRIHQEDLCQATRHPPSEKYQNEGGPSSSDIARLLRQVLPSDRAEGAVAHFLDALTFNWLICGTDAHAKNYSLLLSGSQVRFAPLYDVASALPYEGMPLQKLRLAMKFGGSYKVMARDATMWPRVAKELGIPESLVLQRAAHLAEMIPDAFADAARESEVIALQSSMPTKLVDAVAKRVTQCRRTLESYAELP